MLPYHGYILRKFSKKIEKRELPINITPSDNFSLYIFSVSGPFFPLQLSTLRLVQKEIDNAVPNLVFGSSGGAIVGTLGLACGWNDENLFNLAGELNSSEFIEPSIVPPFWNWLLTGALVTPSSNIYLFIERILKGKLVSGSTELIYGTHCVESRKHVMISSKSKSDSLISKIDYKDWNNHSIIYADYEVSTLTRGLLASCALPNLFDPICIIKGSRQCYMDGGISAPSPWSTFWEPVVSRPGNLKIIYFVSTNVSGVSPFCSLDAFYRMVHNMCSREYRDVLMAFRMRAVQKNKESVELRTENIKDAAKRYLEYQEAVMVCIPSHDPNYYNFSMSNFTGKEIQHIMLSFKKIQYIVIGW